MKILVTGSSGFIGSKIIEALSLDDSIYLIKLPEIKNKLNKVFYYDIYNCDFDKLV